MRVSLELCECLVLIMGEGINHGVEYLNGGNGDLFAGPGLAKLNTGGHPDADMIRTL